MSSGRAMFIAKAMGKTGSSVRIEIYTDRLVLEGTGGYSLAKSVLGAATGGFSLLLTGFSAGQGASLAIPISLVQGAYASNGTTLYADLVVSINGSSQGVNMSGATARLAAKLINLALTDPGAAEAAADGWLESRQPLEISVRQQQKGLRRKRKQGIIDDAEYARMSARIAALNQLRFH